MGLLKDCRGMEKQRSRMSRLRTHSKMPLTIWRFAWIYLDNIAKGVTKMTRAELVKNISRKLDTTEVNSDHILGKVLDQFTQGLKKDGTVRIRGFGSFSVQTKKERMGRNPKTGEPAFISARKRVAFKSSKNLKAVFNSDM